MQGQSNRYNAKYGFSFHLRDLKFSDKVFRYRNIKSQTLFYAGSYGVFDHINLYGENSPCDRPVVLYKGEAPMKEFKSSLAIACDVLKHNDEDTEGYRALKSQPEPENATPIVEVGELLNASRVKETQDLLEAVKVIIFDIILTCFRKRKN